MNKRKILYIDTDGPESIAEFVKVLRQVVDVDTLIIGGMKTRMTSATLRIKEEKYGMPYFWFLENYRRSPMLNFHPVMLGLQRMLPYSEYDGIIVGTYGLCYPLIALGLQGMTGLFTHAFGILEDIGTKQQHGTELDSDYVSRFRDFHFLTQLESVGEKFIKIGHPQHRVHVVPIPAIECPIDVEETYDFSTVVGTMSWDNAKLIVKLANDRPDLKWIVKIYGGAKKVEFPSNVTEVTAYLSRPEYYKVLASAKVGVQPQLLELFGMHIIEHGLFHPVMILEGTIFADDFTLAVKFNERNFWNRVSGMLDSPDLRRQVTERGRDIINNKFSFDNMQKGIDSFLRAATDTAVRLPNIISEKKMPVMENVEAWFR